MSDIQICGLCVVIVSIICGTVLLYKWLKIKAERDKQERAARLLQTENIVHDKFRLAYEDEYARRKDYEFRLKITQRELKRAREQMAKVKIAEVER